MGSDIKKDDIIDKPMSNKMGNRLIRADELLVCKESKGNDMNLHAKRLAFFRMLWLHLCPRAPDDDVAAGACRHFAGENRR